MSELARYDVRFVTQPPDPLDGRGDHAPWPDIQPLSELTVLGESDKTLDCRTMIKACFDADNLYLHYHCVDPEIISTYTERDQMLWEQDVVEAFVCPDGKLDRYFEFNFSPRAVIFDAIITNPEIKRGPGFKFDKSWNANGLRLAAAGEGQLFGNSQTDKWWSVEAAIPFADLNVSAPQDGQQWRINLFRIERAGGREQYGTWSPIPQFGPGFHQADCFGVFVFRR